MVDLCVCCGAVIPEGRQVCRECEVKADAQTADDLQADFLPVGLLPIRRGAKPDRRPGPFHRSK